MRLSTVQISNFLYNNIKITIDKDYLKDYLNMLISNNGDIELHQLHENDAVKNGNAQPFVPSSQGMAGRYRGTRFGLYRVTTYDKIVTGLLVLVNLLLFILALGAIFVGVFMNTYRKSYAYLCDDNEWFVAAGCLLGVGVMLVLLVGFVFYALYSKSSKALTIYVGILALFLIGELTAGIYCFARRKYIKNRFKACMKDAYQKDYGDPAKEKVTHAWDLFQDRFECCGVDDPLDYRSSKVKATTPPRSCGGTIEDALGKQPCFKVIEREVLDNFYIIGGSVVGIAVIQLLAIILGAMMLRLFYKREEFE